ncbi:MAG: TRAP transporter substrate-binding protein [Smithellaceae bacterium]|nr:TRAP transporter substrate-binding protein [Smithellaceae bacterium]
MTKEALIKDTKKDGVSRRKFLTAAAGVAGAAALGLPKVAKAQTPVVFKFQSTWPTKDIFHEFATDYAAKVNAMSAGRLRLDVLPAGAVVGAFGMLDAVNSGVLDGGHGVTAYWYGKHKAFALFGTAPAFGWEANHMLGWFKYGGGEALYNELVRDMLKLNVVGFLSGPMPAQPLGWFKREVTSVAAFKGLKYRTVGLAADVMKEMGAAVTMIPGGEIVPSLDRGVIDAAEFNNPSSDRVLGFPDVVKNYMLQSYHQAMECFEIIFNKRKYDALSPDLQAVLKFAAEAASADMSWKAQARYPVDLEEMVAKQGVKVHKTPKVILEAQLKAWDRVIEDQSKDPFFAKVIASQKAWVKRVINFEHINTPSTEMAYTHFFGKLG